MNDSEILRQIEAQHEESRAFPRTVNRFVAVVPFVKRDASVREVSAGVVALDSKTSLPSTVVVFPYEDEHLRLGVGDRVWFIGDCIRHAWSGQVLELNDAKVLLAPVDQIRLVQEA